MTSETRSRVDEIESVLKLTLSDQVRAAVVAWAEKQPDKPNVMEALRRLIEQGLATD